MSVYNASDSTQRMTVAFAAKVELTWTMLFIVTLLYTVYIVIGVQAVISKDYYCFKNIFFTGQFIHLVSLLAVNLPPPFVYFVQRMSIFGMIEGVFSKGFFLSSFNFMTIDRFYEANFETTSFLSNQALSIILISFTLIGFIIREYVKDKKDPRQNNDSNVYRVTDEPEFKIVKFSESFKLKNPLFYISKRFIFNMFAVIYPYLLLN
jgi:hypothetical protein